MKRKLSITLSAIMFSIIFMLYGCGGGSGTSANGANPSPPTATAPTVSTAVISGITTTGAFSGGNVLSDGDSAVTARGICWGTNLNPSINTGTCSVDGTGTGAFISTMVSLLANTAYHVRAYAVNSVSTAYGNDVQFTTASTPAPFVLEVSGVQRITGDGTNFYLTTVEGPANNNVAYVSKYDSNGNMRWKTLIVNLPGLIFGTDGTFLHSSENYLGVFYTVEDPGSTRTATAPGTMKFLKLDATTGSVIAGTDKIIDRGRPLRAVWDKASSCYYIIYSFKTGVAGGDVMGKFDDAGNLIDFVPGLSNVFVAIDTNTAGEIFIAGASGSALLTFKLSATEVPFWLQIYPPAVSPDLAVLGYDALATFGNYTYIGGMLNVMSGPQVGIIEKLDSSGLNVVGWPKTFPNEIPSMFLTDSAGNLYFHKINASKLARINADGSNGWEITIGSATANAIIGNSILISNGSDVRVYDKDTGNPVMK